MGDYIIRHVTVYRPPKYTVDDVANASLLADLLADIIKVDYSCCVIGYFNLPTVNWVDLTYSSDSINDIIINWFIKAGCNQVVDFPTRNDAILDLIFTNDTLRFSQISCPASFSV